MGEDVRLTLPSLNDKLGCDSASAFSVICKLKSSSCFKESKFSSNTLLMSEFDIGDYQQQPSPLSTV